MPIKFVAACLTPEQARACADFGIEAMEKYARSHGEIEPGCATDFSVHCFNSVTLEILRDLGVRRATLHPELNLAQIRDIKKYIDTEAVIYGRLPLMKLGCPIAPGALTDRRGARFFIHKDMVYNSVPVFMADKLGEVEKSGVTHGRFIFTTETAGEARAVLKAYQRREMMKIEFTRGKYYSRV